MHKTHLSMPAQIAIKDKVWIILEKNDIIMTQINAIKSLSTPPDKALRKKVMKTLK